MCVRSIALGGQCEGVEARGGARLSPVTLPDPSHALLPTHKNSLQKKSLDFVWLITYGHHCTFILFVIASGDDNFGTFQCCRGFGNKHDVLSRSQTINSGVS